MIKHISKITWARDF